MVDASYFLVIRLGPKTSECDKNVTVVSTVRGCDVTNCATTIHGFNKHFLRVVWAGVLRDDNTVSIPHGPPSILLVPRRKRRHAVHHRL